MDLTQLRYFLAVARCESISRAARQLYISQPALSQSIAKLEQSLGLQLFERTQGHLRLNEAGRRLKARAERVYGELDSALEELIHYREAMEGHIFVASSVIDLFVDVIAHYMKQCPDLLISYRLTDRKSVLDQLAADQVELALAPAVAEEPQFISIPLYEDEIFALVSETHPLASRESVTLEELVPFPVCCNQYDNDLETIRRMFEGRDLELNVVADTNEPQILLPMIKGGACVGFCSSPVAVKNLRSSGGLRPIPLSPRQHRQISLYTLAGHTLSPAATQLKDYLIEFCKRYGEEMASFIETYI